MKKTRRPPKQIEGKVRFAWAKARGESPDWHTSWHQPADKATSRLVLDTLSKLGEELARRGYARESIRFECSMPNAKVSRCGENVAAPANQSPNP